MVSQLVNCLPSVDFSLILCHTYSMTYTRTQLINALANEYALLCCDDPQDHDLSDSDYRVYLSKFTDQQLVAEATVDDEFTVDEFIHNYA